jgi:predicted transcriptional regulator
MQDGAMIQSARKDQRNGTRITVTVPPDHYKHVCQMAKEKKVSNAWIIRDAVEKYIDVEAGLKSASKGL